MPSSAPSAAARFSLSSLLEMTIEAGESLLFEGRTVQFVDRVPTGQKVAVGDPLVSIA